MFLLNFVQEAYLINVESEKVLFKENINDSSGDYDVTNKSKILNLNKYLIVKNNIKCLD